jgi:2,4-dienoyl-CoA reductase-like NADH-dependent reductase (Old Yellow Enzyme family)
MEQKDLLGGKGANLAEMTNLGLPVPPGFTITTEACRHYLQGGTEPSGLADEVTRHLAALELGFQAEHGGFGAHADVERALDEGFPFVAMARALLREPDLINRFRADPDHRGRCVHCNRCMPTIYAGAHCPLNT